MDSISRWYEDLDLSEKNEYYLNYCKDKFYATLKWLMGLFLTVYSYLEIVANGIYVSYVKPYLKQEKFFPVRQVIVANPDGATDVRVRSRKAMEWDEVESMRFEKEDTVYVEFVVKKKTNQASSTSPSVDVAMAVFKASEVDNVPRIRRDWCTIDYNYDELSVLGLECYPEPTDQSKKEDITDMYHLYQKCGYGGDKSRMPSLRYLDLVEPQKAEFIVSMGSELQMIDGQAVSHSLSATDTLFNSQDDRDNINNDEDVDETKSSVDDVKKQHPNEGKPDNLSKEMEL